MSFPLSFPEWPLAEWACALTAAGIAGLLTLPLVPLACRIARRLGGVAVPGGRREHAGEIPCLGGVAIVAAAGAAIVVVLTICSRARILAPIEAIFLTLATVIVFVLGVLDDIIGVTYATKFLVQTIAAAIVVALGFSFETLSLPFLGVVELGLLGPVLSVVWIVGITNAINLVDGLDGLAAGIAAIIAASFAALALFQGHALTAVVAAAFGGASLFFLKANWSPARVFMGDSGSLTLGFVLAVLSIHSSFKASAAVAVFVPLLALGLPAIDTLAVMAARYVKSPRRHWLRRFADMFEADRQHLHHLMGAVQRRRRNIVISLYALVAAFCAMALVVALSGSVELGLACLAIELAAVAAIRLLAERRRERLAHALRVAREIGRDRRASRSRIFLGQSSGPPELQLIHETPTPTPPDRRRAGTG